MSLRKWVQRPVLRSDEDEKRERRANWLELFLDLVFVVVVAELAHGFGAETTWQGALVFVLLFVPVWWVWIGHTYYTDRFETVDVSYRLFTFLLMVGVAGMGLHVHDGMGESSVGFALSYMLARALVAFMWWWGGRFNPQARPMTNRYVIGFGISLGFWLVSLGVDAPLRYLLWGVGLVIEMVTPLFTLKAQARLPALTTSHLPERFGIFMILVLREPIAGVIAGMGEESHALNWSLIIDGVLGLLLPFLLWWIYFDQVYGQNPRRSPYARFLWGYLHLPLILGIGAIGAGLLNAYNTQGAPLADPVRWLIAGGAGTTLLAIALLELTTVAPPGAVRKVMLLDRAQFMSAALVLVLGGAGQWLRPIFFFMALLAIVSAPIVLQMVLTNPPAPGEEGDTPLAAPGRD